MNKKLKIEIIAASAVVLFAWDVVLIYTHTRGEAINAYWALSLALLSILYGFLALFTAKHWSWLKSKIGQSIFFISAGIIMWGIGQLGWTYYLFKYPNQEYQPQRILDVLFFASIPLWFIGVLKLTKATGAKYGLQKTKGKLLVALLCLIMFTFSYYFLVVVARGGSEYFDLPLWDQFFGLGYSIGDAIIFTIAIAIFGLSWKVLGGRFKKPIVTILIAFGILYAADFAFSYVSGKDTYYNGDISDLLYLLAITVMSIAVCLLDPTVTKQIFTKQSEFAEAGEPKTIGEVNPAPAVEASATESEEPAAVESQPVSESQPEEPAVVGSSPSEETEAPGEQPEPVNVTNTNQEES